MSKKKKASAAPFYAQFLSEKVREQERLKALHAAAKRVLSPVANRAPEKGPPATRAVFPSQG